MVFCNLPSQKSNDFFFQIYKTKINVVPFSESNDSNFSGIFVKNSYKTMEIAFAVDLLLFLPFEF